MIALVSIGINGILSALVIYHVIRYGKGEPTLVFVGTAYMILSVLCLVGLSISAFI